MNNLTDILTWKMMDFDRDPERVQHFLKVYRFAQLIGHMEEVPAKTQELIEYAALVHDIGIGPAEKKYGRCDGRLQEQEGPAYARTMLTELGLETEDVERICYLVGHHHTYDHVDGQDYQILIEADFLVNFYENNMDQKTMENIVSRVFQTHSGKKLFRVIYGGPEETK